MKTTKKMIPKTDQGIMYILTLLNQLKKHNEAFYANMFKYFTKDHPPFSDSLIFYHPSENFFKFISRSKLSDICVKTWDEYNSGETCLIRLKKFAILSIEPFIIIVSNADFLLKSSVDEKTVRYFHEYMSNNSSIEIEEWKKIYAKITNEVKKTTLFEN